MLLEAMYLNLQMLETVHIRPILNNKQYSLLINPYRPATSYNLKNYMLLNFKYA